MTTLKLNTSVLDSIIFNSPKKTKSDWITDLEQNPETFINPLFQKSMDEMSNEEAEKAFDTVKSYLEANTKTAQDFLDFIYEEINYDSDTMPEIVFSSNEGFLLESVTEERLQNICIVNELNQKSSQSDVEIWLDSHI